MNAITKSLFLVALLSLSGCATRTVTQTYIVVPNAHKASLVVSTVRGFALNSGYHEDNLTVSPKPERIARFAYDRPFYPAEARVIQVMKERNRIRITVEDYVGIADPVDNGAVRHKLYDKLTATPGLQEVHIEQRHFTVENNFEWVQFAP